MKGVSYAVAKQPLRHLSLNLRLGTRASALALWQAEWVAARLHEHGVHVELVLLSTHGDRVQQGPIAALDQQGAFTKELQRALLAGEIDLAVHSLKDLPTQPVEGLSIACVPARGPAADVLVSRDGKSLDQLAAGAVVGTGSMRRRAQLWRVRPDLQMRDVRGNVDTRLRKLEEGQYDALVLAEAGLRRLGRDDAISEVLPASIMLPAVGQGALGVETREGDESTRAALAGLHDPATFAAVSAERVLLHELRGGCLAPVGALGFIQDATSQLSLEAAVLSSDGRRRLFAQSAADANMVEALGRQVAQSLLDQGAAELLAASRLA